MSFQASPTLVQRAVQSLLRDEALAISALKDLPRVLFPALFKEAFNQRQTNILRAMVAVWPFPCLPVGSLMKTPYLESLQAVLDGVDMLLTQVWPRLGEYHTYLLRGAKKPRKRSLQLCCPKLQIWVLPVYTVIEILKVFEQDTVQELELNSQWQLEALVRFTLYLGQMRTLQKFLVAGVYENNCVKNMKYIHDFISQFSKLNCLQHFCMNRISFLTCQMEHLVWCLKSQPLGDPVPHSWPTHIDLNHLPQHQSLWQRKHLNLSGVPLFPLRFKPTLVLLESITATLQTLALEDCELNDSHIIAPLPVLSQCAQITKISFYNSLISMLILKDLLSHTADLSQLTWVVYPAPLERYIYGPLILDRFVQLCSSLTTTLRDIRQPEKASFGSEICPEMIFDS
ncbi:LOW QUALITY PROTEIN: PRAME family member 8-like [Mesocricetus auratus]|uniref:LOW QUALITY PROTEIN: PRAME family member 8-like n=1 Tax=Mesocricetus auratus TaxID=10036 RepID=A0ABM2YHK7_MESAU|nr:LOW QUALITY PROTEIN: PRAME family member 8-like [Mesocricetus auratus]